MAQIALHGLNVRDGRSPTSTNSYRQVRTEHLFLTANQYFSFYSFLPTPRQSANFHGDKAFR